MSHPLERPFTSRKYSDKSGQGSLSMNFQTEYQELLSPPVLYLSLHPAISLPVSMSLVLGLKVWDSEVLGLKV